VSRKGTAVGTPGYSIIEHPSDVGIEATGGSLREAFEQAAHGLIAVILEIAGDTLHESREVTLTCKDRQQLLVQWLSEILYLYDGEGFVPAAITIRTLSPTRLEATLQGTRFSPEHHRARVDVKAVTYHQLLVEETGAEARIRVFLDI
jgi:SHS2 domain-containing protein